MPKVLEPKEIEVEKYDEDDYDNFIEEVYGDTVNIAGLEYSTTYALKELDPTAYRCGFADWQEYVTKYECPICREEHDDEDDARECCQEVYECPECFEKYTTEEEMEECCEIEEDDDNE